MLMFLLRHALLVQVLRVLTDTQALPSASQDESTSDDVAKSHKVWCPPTSDEGHPTTNIEVHQSFLATASQEIV